MVGEQEAVTKMRRSEMQHGQVESNGSWVAMVSIRAEDNTRCEERKMGEEEGMYA
jgi:hypothetical protein